MARKKSGNTVRKEMMLKSFQQLGPVWQAFAIQYTEKLLELQKLEEHTKKVDEYRASGKEFCSFCGRSKDEVGRLLTGKSDTYICDDCVKVCVELLENEEEQ